MLYPPPAQDRQPSGPTPLLRELQQYCPGYFSGSEFGMFGHRRAPLEGSIGVRVTHGIAGYAGNGTTNCAVVPWQGINLNTRPEMTWVLVYKKNATGILNGVIAGFGATGGSSGNTLFRISGEATANSVRFQIRDSIGTTYSNTVSSDFGADDQRYHCVVVSGAVRSLDDGGGFQYYADGKKLNFSPSEVQSGNPASTLFNIATLLCARRGGAISGADGNYDVALFVPLFGIRQPDWWCQEVSRNPWQLFQPERRVWMPAFEAGGGPVSVNYAPGPEVDTAQPLAAQLSTGFSVAAEVDGALAPVASLRPGYSVTSEVDRALAPAASLRAAYGVAVEVDAALPLQVSGVNTYGAAQELDNAYALSAQLRPSYGVATEVDRAFGLATALGFAYGVAQEADAAAAVSARLVAQYGMALEVDRSLGLALVADAIEVPPQRRLIALPGGSTAFYVPSTSTDFSALDF